MKKIIFIALLAFCINVKAQITFEHDYDSAATYNVGGAKISELMIVKFEISGERYVKINRWDSTICIYNLNHSLLKTISCKAFPMNTATFNTLGDILYLSESLFDPDSAIEFMYYANTGGGSVITNIYKEDGTILFSDTGAAWMYPGIPSQQLPIYNTTQGTKMILSYRNGHAKVFSLPGTLSEGIAKANNILLAQSSISNAYPNPAVNTTKIDYTLPPGENEGEIVFYNLQGTEVKRFKVDRTFNTLLISTSDIPAGTYFYQLQTNTQNSGGKKMVVVK